MPKSIVVSDTAYESLRSRAARAGLSISSLLGSGQLLILSAPDAARVAHAAAQSDITPDEWAHAVLEGLPVPERRERRREVRP